MNRHPGEIVEADRLARDQWYPLVALPEIPPERVSETVLLDQRVSFMLDDRGEPTVRLLPNGAPPPGAGDGGGDGRRLPTRHDFGYLWTSLGEPPDIVIDEPSSEESDRRSFNTCTFGINTSAPRAVENFIDMGHLPLIHAGLLGEMPFSEIVEYNLDVSDSEVLATRCLIYQPKASAASTGGALVDYTFRVTHPTCALLYKSSPVDEERLDVVGLFCQPMKRDFIRAHLWDARLDETNSDTGIRRFGQTILAQDRPVLENQVPKELPLVRGEVPVRSDKTGTAYRRWLYDMGWTYGVIRD